MNSVEQTVITRLQEALEQLVPRCHCGEMGVWEWSDEDGLEYVCHEHKTSEHFYAHGPVLNEAAENARKLLEELSL